MPTTECSIELEPDELDDPEALRRRAAAALGVAATNLPELSVLRRSIDARRGRVRFRLLLGIGVRSAEPSGSTPREVSLPARVLIVGAGPGGLFCAYQLARVGVGSIVLDRGKPVQPRRRDLKGLNRDGRVDRDSNYCFGEGGAGTYSDGKLYTRAHKRGSVRDVIETLALHGAPGSILVDARPHIGSNKLPKVVTAMRERLERVGVEFRFGARVTRLVTCSGAVRGVELADGTELGADAVVLATGHSARDVFELIEVAGGRLEQKPFAVGVRVEHPQPLVDHMQYGQHAGHPKLPSASYRLAHTVDDRGVFSFCMCPGGFVVPAATEPSGLVVNGMSLSRRDSPFANAGLVVAVEPEDLTRLGFSGPLAGVDFQRRLEEAALASGGGGLRAPATRVTDFLRRSGSQSVPKTSYQPGLEPTDIGEVLGAVDATLAQRLRGALGQFGRRLGGYVTDEAVLIGVETRTSSPVRVPRDAELLESPDLRGLYPCGEGAGYAGGIVSAALDGIRVGEAIARRFTKPLEPRARPS